MIAFLDANALIYLVEGAAPFAHRVQAHLQAMADADPSLRIAISRLSWLECRIAPLKSGDVQVLADYEGFFALPDLICIELTASVVDLATSIRAHHGLKTPDALQAACCLQLGDQHRFVSGYAGFRRVAGLNVQLLR